MTQLRKHNPILELKLSQYLRSCDDAGLRKFLKTLSVAEFRTAGYMLSTSGLASLEWDMFWKFFCTIVPADSKAYLGTFMKAATGKALGSALVVDFHSLEKFSKTATPIDRRKLLAALLPIEKSPDNVGRLMEIMCEPDIDTYSSLLTATESVACYYVLFKALKLHDATAEQLRRTCIQLMRRQTPQAYRFAAILKAYFGIENLPGTFSLRLEPYKLGRLDVSYKNFRDVMG